MPMLDSAVNVMSSMDNSSSNMQVSMDQRIARRNDAKVLQKQSSSLSTASTSSTSSSSSSFSSSSSHVDSKPTVRFVERVVVHSMVQHTMKQREAMYYDEYDWYRMKVDTFQTVQALHEPKAQDLIDKEGVVTSDNDDEMMVTYGKCIRGLESMRSKTHHQQKAAMQRLHAQAVVEAQEQNKDNKSNIASRIARLSQHMSKRSSRIAQARAKADEVAAKKHCSMP